MRPLELPADALIRSPLLNGLGGVRHGFAAGRTVTGQELTFAPREALDAGVLEESWLWANQALGVAPDRVALMSQVHGASVVHATRPSGPGATLGEADGMWTERTDLWLAVRTADCVPVLFAAPGGIAVAHAGWRGTVRGVATATLGALCDGVGCHPSEVTAAVGPCIGGPAYEVGEEVVQGLRDAGLDTESFLHAHPGPRPHVDLAAAVRAQLSQAGVTRIDVAGLCTHDRPWLHSHRRDGSMSGRLAGFIARVR